MERGQERQHVFSQTGSYTGHCCSPSRCTLVQAYTRAHAHACTLRHTHMRVCMHTHVRWCTVWICTSTFPRISAWSEMGLLSAQGNVRGLHLWVCPKHP